MSEFIIDCADFEDGAEIPQKCGHKFENQTPEIGMSTQAGHFPPGMECVVIIMDDPDAMAAVGKVWVHWLQYTNLESVDDPRPTFGKNDFGEIRYDGPAPPDKRHTYVFKAYALDTELDLKEGYSKQELEDAMKGHILAEAKLTGTFAP